MNKNDLKEMSITVKAELVKVKHLNTIVMINNHLGQEASIANAFDIYYTEYISSYDEETNHTIIHYVYYTEEPLSEQLPAWGI